MARREDKTFESVPLAVALAVATVIALGAFWCLTFFIPDNIRCVERKDGQISAYGINWVGIVDKQKGVELASRAHLSTRCGLGFAAPVTAVPVGAPTYLRTVKDDKKCGNLEHLQDCGHLFPPLLPPHW